MADKVTIDLDNPTKFTTQLRRAGDKVLNAAKAAVYREATDITTDAVPYVPWDEGILKGSHMVLPPVEVAGGVNIVFGFGGAASEYAEVQHENEDFFHPRGGQSKYLLAAIVMHEATLDQRLATHTKWWLAREGIA